VVVVFDDQGNEYIAQIEKLSTQKVALKIKERQKFIPTKKTRITVACAIPKKSKMDDIIDKLTQLGVARFVPLETERVVVRLNKNKKEARLLRWQKIALSASCQSQRNSFTVIEPVKDVRDVIKNSAGYDLKLIPTLSAVGRKTLKEVLEDKQPKNVIILIGPEGDFADAEIKLAQENGFIPVTLGDTVLRVDTASVIVASYIMLNNQ
jgi:16S rRNA (uracil1498-N3)-methyltransferase